MDETKKWENHVTKAAEAQGYTVTDEDMAEINKYALEPLTADDVYVFKATLCDNERDDRNFSDFNARAISQLAPLYVGKALIKDHSMRSDDQVGRVFEAHVEVDPDRITAAGEPHTELQAKVYMLADSPVVKEIKAGIRREVSVDVRADRAVCSICGTDNARKWCRHWPGTTYEVIRDGEHVHETCRLTIDGCTDAFELSLVACGAQPRAMTHKHVEKTDDAMAETDGADAMAAELAVRIAIADASALVDNIINQ